ncbi:ABC transporter ATP-binding protein/permease [Vibrio sp. SM6]|uniref:ABC transporter ATP-binding protein/permease n=1 Tax=Vibrio agarilyticus TaxID=2726741 RepID=A0A7X8TNI1_9VIBR|nr:ABC transporter ATP-binding protein/permease [Vibrio agarilyticus]NLS12006.1 ABC transporter ATP-binding protein/permease [Vibrio agarilyticus]
MMQIVKQFLRLVIPYWCSRASLFSWIIFIATVATTLGLVQVTVELNHWNKAFFDALANFNGELIYQLLVEFIVLVAIIVVMRVYAKWLQQWVEIRWRSWMTERLVTRWMSGHNFYHLTLTAEPDNPDQRIAEDIKMLTTDTLKLLIGLIKSIATLAAFSVILWQLSSGFLLPLFAGVELPGYLLWLAVLYSIIGAGVTHFFGRRLHSLFYQQQKREANFRARLLRNRDHAEQIALMGGQAHEQQVLSRRFRDIEGNWRSLMSREKKLGIVVNTYHQIAAMVPYFAAIPALMAKAITIGGVMQVRMAFMNVYRSLSWFVLSYDDLTRWSATVVRLAQFVEAMEQCEARAKTASRIDTDQGINADKLTVKTPNGETLLSDVSFILNDRDAVMVRGPSGLGKSTLLRTLAGIWPFYQGQLAFASNNTLLLPQTPYLPTGSLRDCLSYPQMSNDDDAVYHAALDAVNLGALIARLDDECEWSLTLSGGEQQKLALARAFVQQPAVLVMDEATSHLDETSAYEILQRLKTQLANTQIIMVTHQSHLAALFERTLDLSAFSHKITHHKREGRVESAQENAELGGLIRVP